MMGFRLPMRSEWKPIQSLMRLDAASDTPSITPSAAAPPPKVARNSGIVAVIISWPISENRLSIPIARTLRVSQRDEEWSYCEVKSVLLFDHRDAERGDEHE